MHSLKLVWLTKHNLKRTNVAILSFGNGNQLRNQGSSVGFAIKNCLICHLSELPVGISGMPGVETFQGLTHKSCKAVSSPLPRFFSFYCCHLPHHRENLPHVVTVPYQTNGNLMNINCIRARRRTDNNALVSFSLKRHQGCN